MLLINLAKAAATRLKSIPPYLNTAEQWWQHLCDDLCRRVKSKQQIRDGTRGPSGPEDEYQAWSREYYGVGVPRDHIRQYYATWQVQHQASVTDMTFQDYLHEQLKDHERRLAAYRIWNNPSTFEQAEFDRWEATLGFKHDPNASRLQPPTAWHQRQW